MLLQGTSLVVMCYSGPGTPVHPAFLPALRGAQPPALLSCLRTPVFQGLLWPLVSQAPCSQGACSPPACPGFSPTCVSVLIC